MIIKIVYKSLVVLLVAAGVSCGSMHKFQDAERKIPVERCGNSSWNSILSSVNANVNYKYGPDSLHHFIQKQYIDKFYRVTGIEYGIRHILVLIRFDGQNPEKIFLFLDDRAPKIDPRICEILSSSLDSLKNDWIVTEHKNKEKGNAAITLIDLMP